jgi:hypothetical protein
VNGFFNSIPSYAMSPLIRKPCPQRRIDLRSIPAEVDTIVVPARDEGFKDVFIGENRWYSIRIHPSMIPKIKNIAVYRVVPEQAITHLASVASIEQWRDSNNNTS